MKLVYVDPEMPGITRKKVRHGWGYWDAKSHRITDREEIDRLNKIALPPAYTDAWFCPSPHGHIQAVGYDAKGRKQYRYHADFRAKQDAEKYDRLADFGRALPLLRAQVERDLNGKPTAHDTVVAAVVRLLDVGHIRVGSEQYVKQNRSFGATTLRNRHATLRGSQLTLQYRAKSGVMRKLTLGDRGLVRVVKKVQDLPGQHLFQYLNEDGEPCAVGSSEVNAYIKEAMGDEFSAKHFRTWHASQIALGAAIEACKDGGKATIKGIAEKVSEALGNTPTIARKSYIHPLVIDACSTDLATHALPRKTRWLSGLERALIDLLEDAARTGKRKNRKAA
jgi:DNA topoisomerase-1